MIVFIVATLLSGSLVVALPLSSPDNIGTATPKLRMYSDASGTTDLQKNNGLYVVGTNSTIYLQITGIHDDGLMASGTATKGEMEVLVHYSSNGKSYDILFLQVMVQGGNSEVFHWVVGDFNADVRYDPNNPADTSILCSTNGVVMYGKIRSSGFTAYLKGSNSAPDFTGYCDTFNFSSADTASSQSIPTANDQSSTAIVTTDQSISSSSSQSSSDTTTTTDQSSSSSSSNQSSSDTATVDQTTQPTNKKQSKHTNNFCTSDKIKGNVKITDEEDAKFEGCEIHGDVEIKNSQVQFKHSNIDGKIKAEKSNLIIQGTEVKGSIHVDSGSLTLLNTVIHGNLKCDKTEYSITETTIEGKVEGCSMNEGSVATEAVSTNAVGTSTLSAQTTEPTATANENEEERYIVVLKKTEDSDIDANDMTVKHKLKVHHVYKDALKGFSAHILKSEVDKVKSDPRVAFIEPDFLVESMGGSDTGISDGQTSGTVTTQAFQTKPTGINRIDADLSTTAKINGVDERVNTGIAILDTGIDLRHPDLNIAGKVTFVSGTSSGNDDNGHGTHVAGIAAAKDNGVGVVGVAPGARLYAVKVLDKNGEGYISNVIAGIDWVTKNAAQIKVVNMSLGCKCHSTALYDAINRSVAAGVTYVVSAGNGSEDVASYEPASYPQVITVSAIVDTDGKCGGLGTSTSYGNDDTRASYSNYGSAIDLAAPGVNIYSTYKGKTYATMSGTSMAAPHVAGAAALYKAINPSASPAQVQSALVSSAVSQTQSCFTSANDGFGGFGGDVDGFPEPLVYVSRL